MSFILLTAAVVVAVTLSPNLVRLERAAAGGANRFACVFFFFLRRTPDQYNIHTSHTHTEARI